MSKKIDDVREHISLLEKNKDNIINTWMGFNDVSTTLTKYNVPIEIFKEKFANGIFDYFIKVLQEKVAIGDCPVMGRFFDILKKKNVAPHELFIICTHLKHSVIDFCFEKEIVTRKINSQITHIFNKNLEGVLHRYDGLIRGQNELISEQQSSLQQYIDAINESTIFSKADPKGNITYVNDKFTEISEYSKEELIGHAHNLVRHPDEPKEKFHKMWQELLSNKPWNGIIKNKKKSGDPYYVSTLIYPITDSNNKLKEFISIRQDLTDSIKLYEEFEDTQKEIIYKMGEVCETRSKETGNHVKRVANYSRLLGTLYGLDKEKVNLLYTASPMHDIGKVGIADSILNKPDKLTDAEFTTMKKHSEIGYHILKGSKRPILEAAAIISYEHHEKWDGTGYPRKLEGDNIHIFGRISAIADVFDALGSDRCYKKAWENEKIFDFFKEQRGKHFDPVLVDLFLKNKKLFLQIKERFKD